MQIFAKRYWAFDPIEWPIISFKNEGDRETLIHNSKQGVDLIAFIGTKTELPAEEDRGRVLGLAEFSHQRLDSLQALKPEVVQAYLEKSGLSSEIDFRWRYALPILRGWKFPSRPLVTNVLQQQLGPRATVSVELLDDIDRNAVLNIERSEEIVPPRAV